jgi:glutaryl-CoA dehydrogenase
MGCFGLTEPNYGSDPGSMITNFKDGRLFIEWCQNVDFECTADIAIVWAKNEEGRIHGLIVERMEGFTTPETHNKWSLRASSTELILTT